jgi:hypothetical protein
MKKNKSGARYKKSRSRQRKFGVTKPTLTQKIKNVCKRNRGSYKKENGETKPNNDLKIDAKSQKINKQKKQDDSAKDNELQKYQDQRNLERQAKIKEDREKEKQLVFNVVRPISKDPYRGMRFVDCSKPINQGRLGHSKAYLNKSEKKYDYY